ncbi:MAG: DUF87 domain-containing protein [Planctomycetes bacterium]|nr:DUF87 domain-containing protein [Planctomycetota bacterium]
MPEKVQSWLRARDTADPDLKSLIDKQIMFTAHKVFGDFRRKILLSLPTEKKAKGSIHLGNIVYDQEKWPLGIYPRELLQNLAIFGRSGAGKTNVTFHILEQLVEKKIPWLFLDWKRTARHLIPLLTHKVNVFTPGRSLSPFPFNPFIVPPGLEPKVYINLLVDVLATAFTLGDGAKSILQRAIKSCYDQGNHAPIVLDVLAEVNKIPDKERVRGWKISTVRALESVEFAELTSCDRKTQETFTKSLVKRNTIVELDGLSSGSKKFLIPMLCLWLYQAKLGAPEREQLSFVCVVEEAHHVLYRHQSRSSESVMDMLLRQCREIGIGMIVVDQHPHLTSSAALGNTYTSICLNLKDPSDINRAAGLSLLTEDEKQYFSLLPVGQGIVKLQDRWRRPILVKFPLVRIKKGLVTDAVLKEYLDGNTTLSGLRSLLRQEIGGLGGFRMSVGPLNEDEVAFINDTLLHQDDGVSRRYKRLGWSADKGNRTKNELLNGGVIEDTLVTVGRTRKLVVRITKEARGLFGITGQQVDRASLTHTFWQQYYSKKFVELGYKVAIEAPNQLGRTDILATKASKRIAIEIETGKSDVVKNVKQNLLAKHSKIIVVATDEAALRKVERELARVGLLIPSRVDVVLRDGLGRYGSPCSTILKHSGE